MICTGRSSLLEVAAVVSAAALLSLAAGDGFAQGWPVKSVTVIVQYPAGGGSASAGGGHRGPRLRAFLMVTHRKP